MPAKKYENLLSLIGKYDRMLVAYSGGVDSTLLAFAAHVVLGDRCLCALATSDTYPTSEVEDARETARELGLRLVEVETNELVDPMFRENSTDRCYHCKIELFGLLRTLATNRGYTYLADGSNVDDLGDHRPGRRAATEIGVIRPLEDAGFTKQDIREVAEMLGLPNWDKPSMACLASRFPYGEEITEEGLHQVANAEAELRRMGLRQFRVRSHGNVARLEVEPSEMNRAWNMRAAVADAIKGAGFSFVAQDLEGYRSGSLNEVLET
ncbi:MAG: ATP-dependent sacrificial sulfur transferase LarE [Actinomycetota bacterium]|jgi:uncharacterized protein|nr:ATP-dependent sacrificial sulfur transferase LarE [Actinomycetota bacterium]